MTESPVDTPTPASAAVAPLARAQRERALDDLLERLLVGLGGGGHGFGGLYRRAGVNGRMLGFPDAPP